MKRGLCTAAITLVLLTNLAAAEMRVWTNINGQIIEAEMTGVNAAKRSVLVRLKSGAVSEILIENLSPPDKEYAKEHWATMQSAPMANATPKAVNTAALPARYANRMTADARLKKILEGGGTAEVEAAVIRSLNLFKTNQNPDGSWGRSNKAAMTGFALQCFLGHGETADSVEYGESVMKGLLYLIDLSKKNPHGLITESWEATKFAGTYEHPIATLAIGEAYILARLGTKALPGLRDCFTAAVKVIISQQSKRGSWGYGGKEIVYNLAAADLSVANWHFLVLEVAKNSSLRIEGLAECIQKSLGYLDSMQTKDGGFGGANRDAHYNQWSLSGGAVTGHILLTGQSTPAAWKAVKFITNYLTAEPPDWNSNCNLYSWHGYTHALFLNGGAEWKNFAALVMPQLIAAQEPDGSFKRGRPNWPASDAADATYRQALCTLILEVFYRCGK